MPSRQISNPPAFYMLF